MTDLRKAIDAAGGLFTQAGLAHRWRVSKAYISDVVRREDFPAPVAVLDDERNVWTGKEADTWRETPRRPGPKPT